MAVAAGTVVAVLAFDLFGTPALIAGSAVLVIAAVTRASWLALIIGVGAAIFLVLVIRAISLCNPRLQDCSPTFGTVAFMTWLGVLAAAGVVTAIVVGRNRPPRPPERVL